MSGEIYRKVTSHWYLTIVLACVAAFLFNTLAFYPGYMSNDSLTHLSQALGVEPMTDLSPPAMTIVWAAFIKATHHVASMLVFQLACLWTALGLFSLYVFKATGSRKLSLVPLSFGLLPFVLNISGVIWKDNQMTFALLLAVAITLYVPLIRSRRLKIALVLAALILTVYAGMVRYNALLAIIPIIYLIFRHSGLVKSIRWQVVGVAATCAVVIGLLPVVNRLAHVRSMHPTAVVMVDGILTLSTEDDLRNAQLPDALKTSLLSAKECAMSKRLLITNFWACANDADRANMQLSYYNELQSYWFRTVVTHPLSYVLYKTQTFFMFIFPPQGGNYIWQDGISPNGLGQSVRFKRVGYILAIYVNNFGQKYFAAAYDPWFWLFVNGVLLVYAVRRLHTMRYFVIGLALSGSMYIFSYYPTGASNDYRYIYWSVFSALLSAGRIYVTKRSTPGFYLSAKQRTAVRK